MSADRCEHDEARVERDARDTRLLDIHQIRAVALAGLLLAAGLIAALFDAERVAVVSGSAR
jgi:hypothetical protein